jgi:DNA-binding HxlR family transcriptional regulator
MAQDTENQGNAISAPASVARMVEDIVGCKWSLAVLGAIRRSILRPGAIERSIAGISTKVLNERLAKMLRYGLLVKQIYPEVPPRVEYRLTPFGERFVALLDQIEALQAQVDTAGTNIPEPKR